ncbi:MAG: CapA family protein [Gemmatimonadales bacterium]|jgi:poly-gamma-glutamate synthesis protein (capsule biosynthesis protein)
MSPHPRPLAGLTLSALLPLAGACDRPPEAPPAAEVTAPAAAPRADLTLVFVGDVMFGRYVDSAYRPVGEDPLSAIAPLLEGDVVLANLETPLVRELPEARPEEPPNHFGAAAGWADELADAGVTAVTLANNHAFDQGRTGIVETPAVLEEAGVQPVGAALAEGPALRVERLEHPDWRIGILAATTVRNHPQGGRSQQLPFSPVDSLAERVVPVLEAARDSHDLLIVTLHWGAEYHRRPDSTQRAAAHAMIDAGADLVIGHHPHVLQGLERYGDGLIAYSLGNFVFDNVSATPRYSGVLKVVLDGADGCLRRVTFDPVFIQPTPEHRPVRADPAQAEWIRSRVTRLSAELGAEWEWVEGRLVLPASDGGSRGG